MRIGVFGGSFDPIHHGHLIVARWARTALRLDQVRFVLAREQPFKAGTHGAGPADRLALLEAALAGESGLMADTCELDRPGPSYTVDTLRQLRTAFPDDQLFFLVGADAARDLPTWREAEWLPSLASVVVMSRPGVAVPRHPMVTDHLIVPAVDVTAAAIRARCAAGDSIRDLVPDAVRALIAQRGMYEERD